jgi:hypothetical protein
MKLQKLNKQLITLCSVVLLFAGSLYYLVAVAFENKEVLTERKDARLNIDDYLHDQSAVTEPEED